MSNTNTNTSFTANDRKVLERKAKAGWKCFFMVRDDLADMNERVYYLIHNNRALIKQMKEKPNEEIDLNYLKSQFIEMYDMVKKNSECPVCMELLTKENMEVPSCGHLICKGCKENVMKHDKKCPCCRKLYYA